MINEWSAGGLCESKVAAGHQLAKGFLDQFVNSLSRKKQFWERAHWDQLPFLSANVAFLQFIKVMHSKGLCTHTHFILLEIYFKVMQISFGQEEQYLHS